MIYFGLIFISLGKISRLFSIILLIVFEGLTVKGEGNLFPTGNMIEMANLLQEFSPETVYQDRLLDHQAEKRENTKKHFQLS